MYINKGTMIGFTSILIKPYIHFKYDRFSLFELLDSTHKKKKTATHLVWTPA